MKPLVRTLLSWIVAVLVAYLLATLVATQSVVGSLNQMGIPISFPERIQMSMKDLLGMAGMFLPLIAAGFLVALSVAGLLSKWNQRARTLLFTLAGAMALICIHLALEWSFDITPVAVARSHPGMLAQGLAGAAGGWVFTRLKPVTA